MSKKKIRAVIKIGTNLLATPEGKLDLNNLRSLVVQICDLIQSENMEVAVVTSGAITCGSEWMDLKCETIPEKQAAAAVGQILLMKEYAGFFGMKGFSVGQLLLTRDGLENPILHKNASNTLLTLFKQGVVPIINENDSVSTEEIGPKFGDNDELSCGVAKLIKADWLILLTDIDGLFTGNPKKDIQVKRIARIKKVDDSVLALVQDEKNSRSRGGMKSKLNAAKEAAESGIDVCIANGRTPHIISSIFSNEKVGTRIEAKR